VSRRRAAAVVVLSVLTAGAATLAFGPRVVTAVGQLTTARHAAPIGRALDVESRWVTPVTGWPSSLAADRDGAVVVAGGGEIRALGRDGSTRWRVDVAGAGFQPPALDRTTVIVGAAGRVVALERATGATRWEAATPDPDAPSAVALAGGVALAGTETGALVAFDARTGAWRWSVSHPGSIRSAPVFDPSVPDAVAATWHGGDDPRLRSLDLATGAVRWDAPITGSTSAAVAATGLVVVGEGDGHYAARIVARSAGDGREVWSTPAPASFESGIAPGAGGGLVAVVDHFGTVTVVDADSGAVRAQTELGEPVLHTTVLVRQGTVALTTHPGNVVVVDPHSGRVRLRAILGGYPAGIARSGPDLLVALRLRDPGRVEAIPVPVH